MKEKSGECGVKRQKKKKYRQQETAKEIMTKCKAFIFSIDQKESVLQVKGVDIKIVHTQTPLMNEKRAKK